MSSVDGATAAPAPKRPAVQMPDEYLPPNKILFLQNLPESVTKDQLMALFSQLAVCFYSPVTSVDRYQISKPVRSPAHPHKTRHRVRGVFGRDERRGCKGRFAQLQARRREQNQGMFLFCRFCRTHPFHRSPLHASNAYCMIVVSLL